MKKAKWLCALFVGLLIAGVGSIAMAEDGKAKGKQEKAGTDTVGTADEAKAEKPDKEDRSSRMKQARGKPMEQAKPEKAATGKATGKELREDKEEKGKADAEHGRKIGQEQKAAGEPQGKQLGRDKEGHGQARGLKLGHGKRPCKISHEQRKHLKRLAKIERIEKVAKKNKGKKLEGKAKTLLEKENRRHQKVMLRCALEMAEMQKWRRDKDKEKGKAQGRPKHGEPGHDHSKDHGQKRGPIEKEAK
jgi:hypothetical protein